MANELGKIRQSAVLMTYGPGAIIDFRIPQTGAPVSVVAAGLEEWERQAEEGGATTADMKRFAYRPLCRKLRVSHFRMPPVAPDAVDEESRPIPLVGIQFPRWLQCPRCDYIRPINKWSHKIGNPSRTCAKCSGKMPGEEVYVVPVRFVTACRHGHLDDFPWSDWVHQGTSCANDKEFILSSDGPGLAGLTLLCPKCKRRRSMEHAFSPEAHRGRRCTGNRPWLENGREDCDQSPITMQRGASNLYFPSIESALVIPPWSEDIVRKLGYRWNEIESLVADGDVSATQRRGQYIDLFWNEIRDEVGDITKEAFKQLVDRKVAESELANSGNLRWDEYQQFMVASNRPSGSRDEFEVRVESVPETLPRVSHLIRVVSLREIRAQHSFTRVEAYPGRPPVRRQFLSAAPRQWLPAIEVRGEGIFVALDLGKVGQWERSPDVARRAAQIRTFGDSRVLNPDGTPSGEAARVGARYLLLHSLAHMLMRQLSLQCGYSAASLREMIYVGGGEQNMAALMIYTATSDADGTLGGLQREGVAKRFGPAFLEAVRANEWCASDPLCIKGLMSATEASSLASCHSCLLAPETSCQDHNRFLDRAMVVGTPEDRSIGFFSDMLGCDG